MDKIIDLRQVALSLLLLMTTALGAMAQTSGSLCRLGLEWTISTSPSWGTMRPVLTDVEPWSPASRAGLRRGDIIERINGYNTQGLSREHITELLHSPETHHTLTITRLGEATRQVLLSPECRPAGYIGERELAELFSSLSPEYAKSLTINYPYRFTSHRNLEAMALRTFAFAPMTSGAVPSIEEEIQDAVRGQLTALGLEEKREGVSDVVVHSFYRLGPLEALFSVEGDANTLARWLNRRPKQLWRYDPSDRALTLLPILSEMLPDCYELQLTIELRHGTKGQVLWSASGTEHIGRSRVPTFERSYDWWSTPTEQGSPLSLEEYCRLSVPVMMQGFPMAPEENAEAQVRILEYHYTGLVFSELDLSRITDVQPSSPAAKAGLRAGDRIRSINGLSIPKGGAVEVREFYLDLVRELSNYRHRNQPDFAKDQDKEPDHSLLVELIDLSGFMWRSDKYLDILNTFSRPRARMGFGYLFSFAPYIPSLGESITFEIERSGRTYHVQVTPERRSESRIYY